MKYNKLVRDKIPELMADNGQKATFRVLDMDEYEQALIKKLDEEVAEFKESKNVEELADIYEVIISLAAFYGHTVADFSALYRSKRKSHGSFSNRIFLLEDESN